MSTDQFLPRDLLVVASKKKHRDFESFNFPKVDSVGDPGIPPEKRSRPKVITSAFVRFSEEGAGDHRGGAVGWLVEVESWIWLKAG